jgi:Xaa-Pro aminopeptidase
MDYLNILPQEAFISHRQRLVAQLPAGSLAVFHSSDVFFGSADSEAGFIQQTDLYYLSGIDQEESILLIFPEARNPKHREILFLKETSEEILIWEGYKLTQEEAREVSGIETVMWTSQFEKIFRNLAIEAQTMMLNTNEHLRYSGTTQTRDQRFIAYCKEKFPLHNYGRLQPILHRIRAVKDQWEINCISQACLITENAFKRVLKFVAPGVKENQIEAEITHEFIASGSRRHAYTPIVASGSNACVLHYTDNHRVCNAGDLLLLDFGAQYANYASDLSRTIPVSGTFSARQKQVYQAVLDTMRYASTLLVVGNTLDEYEKEVGRFIQEKLIELALLSAEEVRHQDPEKPLYKKYFMHGTSHHLGLNVHDYGHRHQPFEAGMVFTCEPGIYIRQEGMGIRLENDFVITDSQPIDLMKNIPIEIWEIEEYMAKA